MRIEIFLNKRGKIKEWPSFTIFLNGFIAEEANDEDDDQDDLTPFIDAMANGDLDDVPEDLDDEEEGDNEKSY